jgi:2,4-dienoyl-CoA reductase-like NADH-dependent reductase (Old Yellow Enzyme family)
MQIMHAGRIAHPDNTPHHRQPVAPSAIASGQQIYTPTGMQDNPVPRALSLDDIKPRRSMISARQHATPLMQAWTVSKSTAPTAT